MTDFTIVFKDTLPVSDLAWFIVDFQASFMPNAELKFGEDANEEPYIWAEVCGVTREQIDLYLENAEIELYAKLYYITEKITPKSDEDENLS